MKDNEKDAPLHKLFELGPKYKAWRETNNLSLEQVSELSGMEIDTLRRVESGENCTTDELLAYHKFFAAQEPNAIEAFDNFVNEVLTDHGYSIEDFEDEESEEEGEESPGLQVSIPDLGPKFKEWREASHITLNQTSELTGMEIDRIVKLENGEICLADEMMTYHEFFFKHIPHAKELYTKFSDELLAKHGYTYDEEGNEYYHGKRDDAK